MKSDGSNKNVSYNISKGQAIIIPLMFLGCTFVYYFGELATWATWDVFRDSFFYGVHDIHRLLFLVPITYAAYNGGVRAAIIMTLAALVVFLPRALFISPYPDPLFRMLLFTGFAGACGILIGALRQQTRKVNKLELELERENLKLVNIINAMTDYVCLIGPDYGIRYMNPTMIARFGDGIDKPCYKYLKNLDDPCKENCPLTGSLSRESLYSGKCCIENDREFELTALPYTDTDEAVCQLMIFRMI